MLEIYNESITDLLCPEWNNLQIREDVAQGTHVENLSQRRVHAGVPPSLFCCLPHMPKWLSLLS